MTQCRDLTRELPGLIAGDVDAGTRARLEEHLATCAACRADLAELREVAALVSAAPVEAEPPSALEAQVFALVSVDDVAGLAGQAPLEHIPPPELETLSLARAGAVRSRAGRAWARTRPLLVPGLTAVAVIALGVGMQERWDRSALQSELSRALPAGEAVGTIESGDGSMNIELWRVPQDNYRLVLQTQSMPRTPPNHHYEVWLHGPHGSTPAGSFRVDEEGENVIAAFQVGVDPADFSELEVLLEPEDGIADPTGRTVYEADIDVEESDDETGGHEPSEPEPSEAPADPADEEPEPTEPPPPTASP